MKRFTYFCVLVLFSFIFWGRITYNKNNEDILSMVRNSIVEQNIRMGDNVRIAILDSGVNSSVVPKTKCINYSEEFGVEDNLDHGMPIYNIIKDSKVGIATNSEVYCIKIANEYGFASMKALENALIWCYENDINIVNLSMSYSVYNENVIAAIEMLVEKGVIIVAAINNSLVVNDYPAMYDGIIAVGYTKNKSNYNDKLSIFFDNQYPIRTISYDGLYKEYVGNSFLAPIVTGIIACIISDDIKSMKEGNSIEQLISKVTAMLF